MLYAPIEVLSADSGFTQFVLDPIYFFGDYSGLLWIVDRLNYRQYAFHYTS